MMRIESRRVFIVLFAALLQVAAPLSLADADPGDPWEGMNRRVFEFNEVMDRNLLRPLAKGYRAVAPKFVDDGVSNFFGNLGEVPSFINHLLQGRVADAGTDSGRFIVNSTLGLFGVFDVASKAGLEKRDTDLGVTLGRWGSGPGPYVMLPFLGPSTVRDTVARVGDYPLHPLNQLESDPLRWGLRATDIVDLRADLLDVEDLITGDRYIFLRNLYLQRRQFLISGDFEEDDFGEDDFGEEDF
jgi:phospholipid-binding lipoprotein MlaA